MVTGLPYKIHVDSQSKLTPSQLCWKFTMFNSSAFYEKKSERLSLWTVGSKLYENPSEGFSCSSCKWGSALSLWLIIHYPMTQDPARARCCKDRHTSRRPNRAGGRGLQGRLPGGGATQPQT